MNRKTSTLISIGVSAVLVALGVWFLYRHNIGFWPENERWSMGHHSLMGAGMGGFMGGGVGIIMIIFWVLIIGAVALLVSGAFNGIRGAAQWDGKSSDPLEILKQRYARGEIDRIEYEEKRRVLSS
ncbi:MAG: SHOCT domain-containing protein [Deltaproteobacteria bacterium]|nr:SHOCT domain-containing protein [Deltaproteobacteria bacterium]